MPETMECQLLINVSVLHIYRTHAKYTQLLRSWQFRELVRSCAQRDMETIFLFENKCGAIHLNGAVDYRLYNNNKMLSIPLNLLK